MTRPIPAIDELIKRFRALEDWEDRYTYLIELGRRLEPMREEDMTPQTLVKGCQATVYLKEHWTTAVPPVMTFDAWSNAAIVSGLIAVLQSMYGGRNAEDILDIDAIELARQMGFENHLSPTRRNGLDAMIKWINALAGEYAAKTP